MINFQMKAVKLGKFEITMDVILSGLKIVIMEFKGRNYVTSYKVEEDGQIKVVGDSNNMEVLIPDLALEKFVEENKPIRR